MKQTLLKAALAFSLVAAPAVAQDCEAKPSCCPSQAKAQVVADQGCEKACDKAEPAAQVVADTPSECSQSCDAKAQVVADQGCEKACGEAAPAAQVVADEKGACAQSCSAKAAVVAEQSCESPCGGAAAAVVADEACEAACEKACDAPCEPAAAVVVETVDPAAKLECIQGKLASAQSELETVRARLVSFETASLECCESAAAVASTACCASKGELAKAEVVTEVASCSAEAKSCDSLPACPVAAYDVVHARLSETRAHLATNRARLLVARAKTQETAAPKALPVSDAPAAPAKTGCCASQKIAG